MQDLDLLRFPLMQLVDYASKEERSNCDTVHIFGRTPRGRLTTISLCIPYLPVFYLRKFLKKYIDAFQDNTDMYGYLLRNRVIFIGSRINDEVSDACFLAAHF